MRAGFTAARRATCLHDERLTVLTRGGAFPVDLLYGTFIKLCHGVVVRAARGARATGELRTNVQTCFRPPFLALHGHQSKKKQTAQHGWIEKLRLSRLPCNPVVLPLSTAAALTLPWPSKRTLSTKNARSPGSDLN